MPKIQLPVEWASLSYWAALARNVLMLGALLTAFLVWSLGWALADTFAAKEIEEEVREHAKAIQRVERSVARVEEDVIQANEGILKISARIMRDRLFELKTRQCHTESQSLRQFYAREVQELSEEYRGVTGTPPATPSCDELR